jgi:hypothetical protein
VGNFFENCNNKYPLKRRFVVVNFIFDLKICKMKFVIAPKFQSNCSMWRITCNFHV